MEGALAVAALPGAHRRPHELAAEGRFAAAGAAEDEGAARLGRVPLLQAVRQLHERPLPAVEALAVQQRLSHGAAAGTHAGLLEAPCSGAAESRGVAATAPLMSCRRAHFCNREQAPTVSECAQWRRIRDPIKANNARKGKRRDRLVRRGSDYFISRVCAGLRKLDTAICLRDIEKSKYKYQFIIF